MVQLRIRTTDGTDFTAEISVADNPQRSYRVPSVPSLMFINHHSPILAQPAKDEKPTVGFLV